MVRKGLLGLGQILGGLARAVTPDGTLNSLVLRLAKLTLIEDPDDMMAQWLNTAADRIEVGLSGFDLGVGCLYRLSDE